MSAVFHDFGALPTLVLLVGMELVLGIDNVLVVSLLAAGFDPRHRRRAVVLGLGIALVFRVAALGALLALMRLEEPVVAGLSWRDLAVIAGGAFLIWKAVAEIHREVEHPRAQPGPRRTGGSFAAAVGQIAVLDLIFSIDSIIAAIGLTPHLAVIVAAIFITFGIVLGAAPRVAAYIQRNPSLRLLCLAFLVCIGASLALDGFHQRFPRGYLYAPMLFALVLEGLHTRRRRNLKAAWPPESGDR